MEGKQLVIVESPEKAKTIQKFLGGDFLVKASIGHIRDLEDHNLSVDVEHGFTPTYVPDSVTEKTAFLCFSSPIRLNMRRFAMMMLFITEE